MQTGSDKGGDREVEFWAPGQGQVGTWAETEKMPQIKPREEPLFPTLKRRHHGVGVGLAPRGHWAAGLLRLPSRPVLFCS